MNIPENWFEFCIMASFGLLWLSVVFAFGRMIKGPTIMDRLLSFDCVAVSIVGLMVVLSAGWETDLYLDLILIFSLVGFLSTVGFTIYLGRKMKEDAEDPAEDKKGEKHDLV